MTDPAAGQAIRGVKGNGFCADCDAPSKTYSLIHTFVHLHLCYSYMFPVMLSIFLFLHSQFASYVHLLLFPLLSAISFLLSVNCLCLPLAIITVPAFLLRFPFPSVSLSLSSPLSPSLLSLSLTLSPHSTQPSVLSLSTNSLSYSPSFSLCTIYYLPSLRLPIFLSLGNTATIHVQARRFFFT